MYLPKRCQRSIIHGIAVLVTFKIAHICTGWFLGENAVNGRSVAKCNFTCVVTSQNENMNLGCTKHIFRTRNTGDTTSLMMHTKLSSQTSQVYKILDVYESNKQTMTHTHTSIYCKTSMNTSIHIWPSQILFRNTHTSPWLHKLLDVVVLGVSMRHPRLRPTVHPPSRCEHPQNDLLTDLTVEMERMRIVSPTNALEGSHWHYFPFGASFQEDMLFSCNVSPLAPHKEFCRTCLQRTKSNSVFFLFLIVHVQTSNESIMGNKQTH